MRAVSPHGGLFFYARIHSGSMVRRSTRPASTQTSVAASTKLSDAIRPPQSQRVHARRVATLVATVGALPGESERPEIRMIPGLSVVAVPGLDPGTSRL